jgi:hypothetical protein
MGMLDRVRGAVEPSDTEVQDRAEHAYALDQRIKESLRAGRESLWDVAAAAHEFDDQAAWSALGYETIGDWLADPEVSMTRGTFYRIVRVYRELVVRRQLPVADLKELEVSKVDIVLGKVKSGEKSLDTALNDVKTLGARDLRDTYYDRRDPKDDSGVEEDDLIFTPDAPDDGGVDGADEEPVIAAEVVEEEPAHNSHMDDSGQLHAAAVQMAEVLRWVDRDVAPPEKKRMTNELREAILDALGLAGELGLLSE